MTPTSGETMTPKFPITFNDDGVQEPEDDYEKDDEASQKLFDAIDAGTVPEPGRMYCYIHNTTWYTDIEDGGNCPYCRDQWAEADIKGQPI